MNIGLKTRKVNGINSTNLQILIIGIHPFSPSVHFLISKGRGAVYACIFSSCRKVIALIPVERLNALPNVLSELYPTD